MEIKSILFVCLGNICRSPIAQGVTEKYVEENNLDIKVDSAGTSSWHIGENPCENSIAISRKHDVDISKQKARQVTTKDFTEFDLIVALDDSNLNDLKEMGCKNPIKLGDFGFNGEDVPDPYFFKGLEGFDKVYEMIDSCVNKLLASYIK